MVTSTDDAPTQHANRRSDRYETLGVVNDCADVSLAAATTAQATWGTSLTEGGLHIRSQYRCEGQRPKASEVARYEEQCPADGHYAELLSIDTSRGET